MVLSPQAIGDLVVSATGVGALVATAASRRRTTSIPIRFRRLTAFGGGLFWLVFLARQLLIEPSMPVLFRLLASIGAIGGLIASCLILVQPKSSGLLPAYEFGWRPAAVLVGFPALGAILFFWATGLKSGVVSRAGSVLGLCLMAAGVAWAAISSRRQPFDSRPS